VATDFQKLIDQLLKHRVDFVVVGGVAVVAHGYPRATEDLDIVYSRDPENLGRLVQAISPLKPWLRGAPRELPFSFDERTLRSGLNFTLSTEAGDLDLLGEMTGVGGFQAAAADAPEYEIFGHRVRIATLEVLEKAKRAAGRVKDLLDLEAIRAIKARK
jgi:hypothetical protein